MSNRWLSIRVEFLGNFIVFFAAVFAFYLRYNFSFGNETLKMVSHMTKIQIQLLRDTLSPGVIALSISYAMQMIDGFGWTIRLKSNI